MVGGTNYLDLARMTRRQSSLCSAQARRDTQAQFRALRRQASSSLVVVQVPRESLFMETCAALFSGDNSVDAAACCAESTTRKEAIYNDSECVHVSACRHLACILIYACVSTQTLVMYVSVVVFVKGTNPSWSPKDTQSICTSSPDNNPNLPQKTRRAYAPSVVFVQGYPNRHAEDMHLDSPKQLQFFSRSP